MNHCPAVWGLSSAEQCLKTGKVVALWWRGLSWRCPSEVKHFLLEAHRVGSRNFEPETQKTWKALPLKALPLGSIDSKDRLRSRALQ